MDRTGRFALTGGAGTAKVVMAGAGPAFHLVGTHGGSAQPEDFKPAVWAQERMPAVLNIEIEGRHPEADGFWLEGTMQSTFEGVLLRRLRHGIRVQRRARNLLVSHSHIYDNAGCGIFIDQANLHQVNIAGCHISYNVQAGIHILGGQVRNVQIAGNDIEYNYDRREKKLADSADVLIDCRPEGGTINEMAITGNTIQAVPSAGGANIRILGNEQFPEGSAGELAISGNLIGSQETGIHLVRCAAVAVSGNMIYGATRRNLFVEHCRNIVIGPNSVDHNTESASARQLAPGIRITDSRDVSLTGVQIMDAALGRHTDVVAPPPAREGLLELVRCTRATLSGLHVIDGVPYGLFVADSRDVTVTGCTIFEARTERLSTAAIKWTGAGKDNWLTGCRIGAGRAGAAQIAEESKVRREANYETL